MKIAILGAGVSGLSLYLFLEKHGLTNQHDVTIFEAREAKDQSPEGSNTDAYNATGIGGAIGLNPTGMKVLARIDPKLQDEILKAGHITLRCILSNSRGWTLADVPAVSHNEKMVSIGRDAFWSILKRRVPESVIVRKKVADVVIDESGNQKPRIMFQDQTTQEPDLLVGADGIWSVTRRSMFGVHDRREYEYSPQYEGLVGTGGFVPSSLTEEIPDNEMHIINGANGFFGITYVSSSPADPYKHGDTVSWWSTYTLKDCPDDWRNISKEDIEADLKARHGSWKNQAVQNIIRDVKVESVYPMFITPLLPTWQKGGCVLIGDSAHALQPSSGQGASMAMEDSETLALLLKHYLAEDPQRGHLRASELYSEVRMPRLAMVHKKAQELAGMKHDMGIGQEMVMYFFIWLAMKLKLNESYNTKLNSYDVPAEVEKAIKKSNSSEAKT